MVVGKFGVKSNAVALLREVFAQWSGLGNTREQQRRPRTHNWRRPDAKQLSSNRQRLRRGIGVGRKQHRHAGPGIAAHLLPGRRPRRHR